MKCIVCKSQFERRSKAKRRKIGIDDKKRANAVTCCHECSVEFNRHRNRYLK